MEEYANDLMKYFRSQNMRMVEVGRSSPVVIPQDTQAN